MVKSLFRNNSGNYTINLQKVNSHTAKQIRSLRSLFNHDNRQKIIQKLFRDNVQ